MEPKNIVSPAGTAVWPKLNKPDTFKNKTTFNVKLKLDTNDEKASAFIAQINEAHEAALGWARGEIESAIAGAKEASKKGAQKKKLEALKLAESPVKPVLDEDGNETNFVTILFKCNAEYKDSKTGVMRSGAPVLKDAKRNVIDRTKVEIGGGSTIKVAAMMKPYLMETDGTVKAGISFRLKAVQVLELKQFNADDGFEDEEGFEAGSEGAGGSSGDDDF
jgi:hypothetical protein